MRLIRTGVGLGLLLAAMLLPHVLAANSTPLSHTVASDGAVAAFARRGPAQAATATVIAPAATTLPPTEDQSAASVAGTTDTQGQFFAALIILAVVAVLVAVTAFLVWRTRPRR